MHVLLVDDGSTDPMTVGVVEELAAEWPNVTAYRHAPGGSGSASRPRNTGLDLTTTPYVTYLDPDNEMVEDASPSSWPSWRSIRRSTSQWEG